jgi:hypothetical protein
MEPLPPNLRRRLNLSSIEKTLESILENEYYVNGVNDVEDFVINVVGALRDNLIMVEHWDDLDDAEKDFLYNYLYDMWEDYLRKYYMDVTGGNKITEGVNENSGLPLSLRRRVSLENVETLVDRFLQFGNYINETSNYADFVTELIADLTDRIVVESGSLFSLSDDDYRTLNVYLFDTYEPYLSQYYKNAMKDKGLQEEVQRIKEVMGVITEDLDKSVIRRIDFSKMNELVYYFMGKRIDYSGVHTIETMVYSVARTVAHELLAEKELRKFDNQQVFDELVKFIMDIYGKELKDYFVDKIVKHNYQ